ncbi:hypothetical protein HDU96_003133 [Phlyctochytrium bullatum]|nr:hypothetical protein HDU96_003133 [Phlyctochytrium bullatum]
MASRPASSSAAAATTSSNIVPTATSSAPPASSASPSTSSAAPSQQTSTARPGSSAFLNYQSQLTVGQPITGFVAEVWQVPGSTGASGSFTLVSGSNNVEVCAKRTVTTTGPCENDIIGTQFTCYKFACTEVVPAQFSGNTLWALTFAYDLVCPPGTNFCSSLSITTGADIAVIVPPGVTSTAPSRTGSAITNAISTTSTTSTTLRSSITTSDSATSTDGTSAASSNGSGSGSSGVSGGLIGGIVAAVVIVALLIAGFFVWRRVQDQRARREETDHFVKSQMLMSKSNLAASNQGPLPVQPNASLAKPLFPEAAVAAVPAGGPPTASSGSNTLPHPRSPQPPALAEPVPPYGGAAPTAPAPAQQQYGAYGAYDASGYAAAAGAYGYPAAAAQGQGYYGAMPAAPAQAAGGQNYPGYYDEHGNYHYYNQADDPRYQQQQGYGR